MECIGKVKVPDPWISQFAMSEMVPANQGVIATTHAPQSAEGTPILDTSTSSGSAMGDVRGNVSLAQFNQLNQQVRVEKAQILQQQQNECCEFDSRSNVQ